VELLGRKVSAPVYKTKINDSEVIHRADHATPLYPQKLKIISPISGGRSVGIFHLRTKGHGVCFIGMLSSRIGRRVPVWPYVAEYNIFNYHVLENLSQQRTFFDLKISDISLKFI
jgi:hypothetical protein